MTGGAGATRSSDDERSGLEALREVLDAAQRTGMVGDAPVDEVIAHAMGFVRVVSWCCPPPGSPAGVGPTTAAVSRSATEMPLVMDLGSGGGVPGLVIAHYCPWVRLVLVDRRAKRVDHLERAVRKLGLGTRVLVQRDDVRRMRKDPAWRHRARVVVARGFGPPVDTLQWATELCEPHGWVAISEPPPEAQELRSTRWPHAVLDACDVVAVPVPSGAVNVAMFQRRT